MLRTGRRVRTQPVVQRIIRSAEKDPPAFALNGFGVALGVLEENNKYHLFADDDTATFVVRAMNRQLGRDRVTMEDVYPYEIEPSGVYKSFSRAGMVREGCRTFEALLDPFAVRNAECAAARVLTQLDGIAQELTPYVELDGPVQDKLAQASREPEIRLGEEPVPYNQAGGVAMQGIARWLRQHTSPYGRSFWLSEAVYQQLYPHGITAED